MTVEFDPRRDAFLAFTTPIAKLRLPEAAEINPGLRQAILDKAASDPGQTRSNIGGWHSRDDLLTWPQYQIAVLKAGLIDAVSHMTRFTSSAKRFTGEQMMTAWANICGRGAYHKLHNHPTFHWSGVYYVTPGDAVPDNPHSGALEFQDPRGGVEMTMTPGKPFGRTLAIQPEAGLIVIFPSWLHHWVNPYDGESERISIAFNARITNFEVIE